MLTLNQVLTRISSYKLTKVAEDTGLKYSTLCKFVRTQGKNARYEFVEKLSDYLIKGNIYD
jgi:hypothetical protein